MVNRSGPGAVEHPSRSDSDRCLIALAIVVATASAVAHVFSFFHVVIIGNRPFQKLVTWTLAALLLWTLFRSTRTGRIRIPRFWWLATLAAWMYGLIYASALPIGDPQNPVWPAIAQWLGLNGGDLMLVYARASAAVHFALALSLFEILWHHHPATATPDESA